MLLRDSGKTDGAVDVILDPDLARSDQLRYDLGADLQGPLPGLGLLSGECGVLDNQEWSTQSPFVFTNSLDLGNETFAASRLSSGGQQILSEGNLNPGSLHSEIMAYEVLFRCEHATLLKGEKSIAYDDPEGKKTDILVEIDARKIGVSVTRAYHYPTDTPYTEAEARVLLEDKLADLPLSQENALLTDRWVRSVLHVMAYDETAAASVRSVWADQLSASQKGEAIVIITVTSGNDDFIY